MPSSPDEITVEFARRLCVRHFLISRSPKCDRRVRLVRILLGVAARPGPSRDPTGARIRQLRGKKRTVESTAVGEGADAITRVDWIEAAKGESWITKRCEGPADRSSIRRGPSPPCRAILARTRLPEGERLGGTFQERLSESALPLEAVGSRTP
jgi:hypothetical protein